MNRLISKVMSNISLKVTIDKNWRSQNIDFLNLKKFVSRSVFGQLQLIQISPNFTTSCSNYWGQKKKQQKTKKLLFPEMRVMRKISSQAAAKNFFFNRFSGYILFSSLVSFAFSDSSFFELKNVYSDTHWTIRAGEW